MSMFFVPDELMPDARTMEANLRKISRDMDALTAKGSGATDAPAGMFAAPAAFMVLGAGMAGHAFGMWLSAVSSSLQIAERMSAAAFPEMHGEADTPSNIADRSAKPAGTARAADAAVAGGNAARRAMNATAESAADVVVPLKGRRKGVAAKGNTATPETARPAAIERPKKVDDLKAISGVGPKLEQVLNGLGIWTYRQIAGLGEAEIRWLEQELGFTGRIVRDGWVGQAVRLAGKG